MVDLQISFISFGQRRFYDGEELSPKDVENPPALDIDFHQYGFFTLMMYDIDASQGYNLYYLVTNISKRDIIRGDIPVSYLAPDYDVKNHRFRFDLLYQERGHQFFEEIPLYRINFPVNDFISKNGLSLVNTSWWIMDPPGDDSHSKACRCVYHVAAKNNSECNRNKNWGRGTGCGNPYAICSASTHGSVRDCHSTWNFDIMTDREIEAIMEIKNLPAIVPFNRQSAISAIKASI